LRQTTPDTDHYATLGLDRRCTVAQIRNAYRLLAKRHHPDVNGGSPESGERLREINAAHEVLGNPSMRRAYDRELAECEKNDGSSTAPAAKIERNISQDAHLRVDEFLRGASLEVRVKDPGNPHGDETYTLAIPAGTAPGERFRIPRTEPFDGGFVIVRVKAMPGARFKVRGSDLRCDLRISSRTATHGGSEMMPGPAGSMVRVQIPAGVARGAILRIVGEGLPKPRGGRGDLLMRVTYQPEVRITRSRRGW
jgi:DnaJ-class molecular chaperone